MEKHLILLDACVVIELFSIGCWDAVIRHCGIFVSEQVIGESEYYLDERGDRHDIDLQPFLEGHLINTISVTAGQAKKFKAAFGPYYAERMDPGELELLAFLHVHPDVYYLCSSDSIAFKTLGRLGLSERAISLESLLAALGIKKKLPKEYTTTQASAWLQEGRIDRIQGFGLIGDAKA